MSQFDNYLNYYEAVKCAFGDHQNHIHPEVNEEESEILASPLSENEESEDKPQEGSEE